MNHRADLFINSYVRAVQTKSMYMLSKCGSVWRQKVLSAELFLWRFQDFQNLLKFFGLKLIKINHVTGRKEDRIFLAFVQVRFFFVPGISIWYFNKSIKYSSSPSFTLPGIPKIQ